MSGKRALWPLALLWLLLLPTFSWVQWSWLNRMRDADADHMSRMLEGAVEKMRNEFDGQLASIYNQFRVSHTDDYDVMSKQLDQHYLEHRQRTDHTHLISRVFWVTLDENRANLHEYLPWENKLAAISWPTSFDSLHSQFNRLASESRQMGPQPFQPDVATMVIPTIAGSGVEASWMLVKLNESYMVRNMLPKMADDYLQVGSMDDYHIGIVKKNAPKQPLYLCNHISSIDQFEEVDLQAGLLSLRMAQLDTPLVATKKGEHALAEGHWEMLIQHRKGSLVAAANVERNFNAAMLGLMVMVLSATFIAPFLMLHRGKSLLGKQLAFFSGLSHDLRAPLSVISSAAFNLSRSVVNDPNRVKQYGGLIRSESSRLQDMVNQVLEYSRAHAGGDTYFLESQSAATLVEEVMNDNNGLLQKHNIELSLLVDEDLPPVFADARALKSAVGNLVTNAVKYGGARCWMGVRVFRDGHNVSIEVADRGQGIPQEEQGRLFDAYYRADAARNSSIEGSGLGLNMVKQIMKRHGGKVNLRSSLGEGAAFCLTLPILTKSQSRKENGGLLAWKKRFSW